MISILAHVKYMKTALFIGFGLILFGFFKSLTWACGGDGREADR